MVKNISLSLCCLCQPFSVDQPVEETVLIEEEVEAIEETAVIEEEVKGKTTVSWQPSEEDYYRCLSDTCRDTHRANTQMASLKVKAILIWFIHFAHICFL